MTAILEWPATLLPRNVQIRNPRKTVGLNTSLNQFDQAVPAIRPPFGATLEFDDLTGGEVLAWRALLAGLEGRANVVRLPLFDFWLAAPGGYLGVARTSHSDGSPFSDGTLYSTTDISGVLVNGVAGQRTITADFGDYGQMLQAGQYFGLGDQPYMATGVTWAGNVATIRHTASLRRTYVDEPLRLRPVMLARLTDDDQGQTMLQNMRWMRPEIDFTEAFL